MTAESRGSDQYQVLLALLADGEWHDYYAIVAKAAKTVLPGAAVRKCEQSRAIVSARHNGGTAKPRIQLISREEQIRTGSRQIIVERLQNAAFEVKPPGRQPVGEPKWVRLKPQVNARPGRCSVYVEAALNLISDGRWHDWDVVLKAAMAAVPEERAMSYLRAHRVRERKTPIHPSRVRTREQELRDGAHGVAYQALTTQKSLLVKRRNGKPHQVRLRKPTDV